MTTILNTFVKTLKTAQLVGLYNLVNATSDWKVSGKAAPAVKKFADRATAEKRILKLMTSWDGGTTVFSSYNEFYADFASASKKIGVDLPTPEEEKVVASAKKKAPKKEGAAGKSKTPPHLNLRCDHEGCGYYIKTTPFWLKKGRVICPMDKSHGILKTAEERGEKRGR
jgi:hypothetical protein